MKIHLDKSGSLVGIGHWPRFNRLALAQFRIEGFFREGDRRVRPIRPVPDPPNRRAHINALVDEAPIPEFAGPLPLVTVVILNRNGAQMLDDLLLSMKRVNTYPNLEIVVVDHASSDASLSVVAKWSPELPVVIVPCSVNYSFAYSCNRAAERARGEYLFFLNNDIVLTEDVIGALVSSVRRHDTVAGCKLIKGSKVSQSTVHHIGVRFEWHIRHRFPAPYEAIPKDGDERLADYPATFFAVTGAALMCARETYLAIGGMHEEYYYGFEDVDLCLKLALGHGKPIVCQNDLTLFHRAGITRKAVFSAKKQRKIVDDNVAVLKRRFGYAVRRTTWPLLFADDGSIWGRSPRIVLASRDSDARRSLADTLRRTRNWEVCTDDIYQLTRCDLLIVADPAYRMNRVKRHHPMMVRVAWIAEDPSTWSRQDFSLFDAVIARDEATAECAARMARTDVEVIDPVSDGAADSLVSLIVNRLRTKHRFGIKLVDVADLAVAVALAAEWRSSGHSVRIDPPDQWECRDSMRDDVVLFHSAPRKAAPLASIAGKISIACGETMDGVDASLPLGPAGDLASAVMSVVNVKHRERMRGPIDPPLK